MAALMYMKTRLVRVRGPGGRLTFGPSGEAEVVSARGYASFLLHLITVDSNLFDFMNLHTSAFLGDYSVGDIVFM